MYVHHMGANFPQKVSDHLEPELSMGLMSYGVGVENQIQDLCKSQCSELLSTLQPLVVCLHRSSCNRNWPRAHDPLPPLGAEVVGAGHQDQLYQTP